MVFFNRISRLIWRLGSEFFIPCCNYFDGYPVFAPSCIADSTMSTALALLDLLGISYSADKLVRFDRQATMLGVEISRGEWKDKKIVVRNKESRSKELLAYVKNLKVGDRLSPKEFLGVIGRFQFAEAQVMGRIGKLALGNVRAWMNQREVSVDGQLKAELMMLGEVVRHERPRLVPPLTRQQPILVFSDGASEDCFHVVGGLIFLPGDDPPRFFGSKAPMSLVDEWFMDMKHIIGPVETYAVLVARALWHKHLVGTRCIYCISLTIMVQWMLVSRVLHTVCISGGCCLPLNGLRRMAIIGLGSQEGRHLAILRMIRQGWDWLKNFLVWLGIAAYVPFLVAAWKISRV